MTYEEAVEKLKYLFHKTRLTKHVYVPSEIISAILYSEKEKTPSYLNIRRFEREDWP